MDYPRQLLELVAQARPGARVIYIEIPADAPHAEETEASDEGPGRELPAPRTDLEAASRIDGNQALKVEQWAELLGGISGREIERALAAEVLSGKQKGYGRDWAALVITGRNMVDYLAECDAVQRGDSPPPRWWSDVRKGANATIHKAA